MVLEKLPRAFGAGGPGVETVLDRARLRPGDQVTGQVHLEGGDQDADVEHITLRLVARSGVEPVELHHAAVSGPFRLAAGERRSVAFAFGVPWETPLTGADDRGLPGTTLGMRTEVSGEAAVDALHVSPLPSQDRVLDAFERLGLVFAGSTVEHGRVRGLVQELPGFQELGFRPPAAYTGQASRIGLTFVADRHHLAVVLEADRDGGPFGESSDDFGRWIFPHETAIRTDWEGLVGGWLDELPARSSPRGSGVRPPAGGAMWTER